MVHNYIASNKQAVNITKAEVRDWLRVGTELTDDEIAVLLDSAVSFAEEHTRKTLSVTTFTVSFFETTLACFELRKCPFISLTEVLVSGEVYNLDDIKVNSTLYPYASIYFDENVEIDSIEFTAGYTVLPPLLKTALLNMVAYLYENRGDCMSDFPSYILCSLNKAKIYSL